MTERVLLVIDGDNVDNLLKQLGARIEWAAFRDVVPRACSMYAKRTQRHNSELTEPVSEVMEAHHFSTVWPPPERDRALHQRHADQRETYFRASGFRAHCLPPQRVDHAQQYRGHHDQHIVDLVEGCWDEFDTLIMVSGDWRFGDLCHRFNERRWRSYLVGSDLNTSYSVRHDKQVPFIDIVDLQNFFSQTVAPPVAPRKWLITKQELVEPASVAEPITA